MTTWKYRLTGPITKSEYKYRITILLLPVFMLTYLSASMLWNSFQRLDEMELGRGEVIYKEISKEKLKGTSYTFVFRLNSMDQFLGIFLGSGNSGMEEGKYWDREIQIGDSLVIYYDNNFITETENITRLIRKIEKGSKIIYEERVEGQRMIGLFLLELDIFLIGMIIWIKKRYYKSKMAKMNADSD